MTSLEGWPFFCPDHCIVEGGYDGQVYGAVYSSSDMNLFDVKLRQLRAIENEKAFECENNLPFTSLVTLDMRYLANNHIVKKEKVQSVLVNQKPKVNAFMKQKWERDKSKRREALKRRLEEYKERVMTDKKFAKKEE
jgi:hypothetical protein